MKETMTGHSVQYGGIEVRQMRADERQRMSDLTAQAFALPPHRFAMHTSTPLEEVRVLTTDGQVQGLLRVERIGQFFGGCTIPSAAISLVLVAVEGRGRGLGKTLVREVLSELRKDQVALSTLYPAGVGLYRCLGYEFAGSWTRYQVPIQAIPRKRSTLDVVPWDDASLGDVMACYRRIAQLGTGSCDRTLRWWERRVLGACDRPIYRWLVRRDGVTIGYAVYSQVPDPSGAAYAYSLECRDLLWEDADAGWALLRAASSHHGLGVNLSWPGPTDEPLLGFVDAEEIGVRERVHWMTRLVDVRRALELRLYDPDIKVALEMFVVDDILPENQGPIRIEVSNGRATVSHTTGASARVDVGALAALYTGWWPARTAARAGRLQHATPHDLDALDRLFCNHAPWMLDRF